MSYKSERQKEELVAKLWQCIGTPFPQGKEEITPDDTIFNRAKPITGKVQAGNILRKYDNALMKRYQVSYDIKKI